MKNRFSILLASFLLLAFISCKKQETKDYYEGGTAPKLTASTSTVTLEPGQEANTAITLNWTNPDYKFTSGPSSQDVTYTLEIDTLGGNFSSGKKYTTTVTPNGSLSITYTVAQLNDILGNTMLLQLNPRRNYTLQARVISSIGSNVQLASNAISFTTKPFAPPPKVTPPGTAPNYTDGHLYLVGGDSKLGAWQNGGSYAVQPQEFTRIPNTFTYTITVQFSGGDNTNGNDQYLFVPVWGDWTHKYACKKTSDQPADGGDFGLDFSDNFPGPTAAGTYKITVDFQLGKYTVVKQ